MPELAPLSAEMIRAGLSGRNHSWRRLDIVDETGSTNADLVSRAAAGEDISGAVLLAEHQTAGRGRHGRTWSAPARSQISMSVGVDTAGVPAEAWGWLPLLTGVALVDAVLAVTGIEAGLKWPNDVLVGTGKLAGILAEVAAPAPVIVVGLGLNVTLNPDELPDPRATSLLMLNSPVIDRNLLAAAILRALTERITSWRTAGGADKQLVADYVSRSLTLGTQVRASLPGDKLITGTARAIDELGRLRIDTGVDTVTVSAGDVTHLHPGNDTPAR